MATMIYEIHSAKSGRCVGYLPEEEAQTARLMQDAGYIVIQEMI